jgi:uncharacterized protein
MTFPFSRDSPLRIFAFSGFITIAVIAWSLIYLGWEAVAVTAALILIELTFSFDNAIINAKVLTTMSPFWQKMFMTIGILIAVFGMRVAFPIVIVMVSVGLPWNEVLQLAINQPHEYAHLLEKAHPNIAAFGGIFLLTLCLHFLLDDTREILWLASIERRLQKFGKWWQYATASFMVLLFITLLPFNHHAKSTLISGTLGLITYLLLHSLTAVMTKNHDEKDKSLKKVVQKTGLAGFATFLYLEVLDASFSFDGVMGAFALTSNVVLIGVSLGVGAVWVRSLTLYMVRRKVLDAYLYLEHGAHYTIGALAIILLVGLFYKIPEVISGGIGIVIITLSIISSIKQKKEPKIILP